MLKPKNILVTRELSDQQLQLAETLGLHVTVEPAIKITVRNDWVSVRTAVTKSEYPVFVFTSQNGVRAFLQFVKAGLEIPETPLIYAVGNKTSELLKEHGYVSLVPDEQNGAALARLILDDLQAGRLPGTVTILHFSGNRRRDELRQMLTEAEVDVKDLVVYRTVLNQMNISSGETEGILFYSPSAVQAFRQSGGFRNEVKSRLFAIGPTTAEELSIESGEHVYVSPEPDTETFLKFVATVLTEKNYDQDGNSTLYQKGKEQKSKKSGKWDDKNLYYNRSLKELARELRNNSTKSEIKLWSEVLRGGNTGFTFLRQRPVLNYIADFLCKELKLIIELDGYSHNFAQQWKKDLERQKELEKAGFKVLRFSDDDVLQDIRNVESEIMYWIEKLGSKSPP